MSTRIVLITGANSGVGFATTKVLASSTSPTFQVIMTGRNLAKVNAAKSELINDTPNFADRLSVLHLDVTDKGSITAAVEAVKKEYGHLDALINNAAVGNTSPDTQTRFRASFEVNVTGPATVADAFRPLLLASPTKSPYGIYVSSGAGSLSRLEASIRNPDPNPLPQPPNPNAYMASKAALNMVALQEWNEFRDQGLKVVAMTPGFVVSNLRGESEELRSGWGKAGDPTVSGNLILSILKGERDHDLGKFVKKDGVYGW